MSQMEEAAAKEIPEVTELAQRKALVNLYHARSQHYEYSRLQGSSHPEVVFLDTSKEA